MWIYFNVLKNEEGKKWLRGNLVTAVQRLQKAEVEKLRREGKHESLYLGGGEAGDTWAAIGVSGTGGLEEEEEGKAFQERWFSRPGYLEKPGYLRKPTVRLNWWSWEVVLNPGAWRKRRQLQGWALRGLEFKKASLVNSPRKGSDSKTPGTTAFCQISLYKNKPEKVR